MGGKMQAQAEGKIPSEAQAIVPVAKAVEVVPSAKVDSKSVGLAQTSPAALPDADALRKQRLADRAAQRARMVINREAAAAAPAKDALCELAAKEEQIRKLHEEIERLRQQAQGNGGA